MCGFSEAIGIRQALDTLGGLSEALDSVDNDPKFIILTYPCLQIWLKKFFSRLESSIIFVSFDNFHFFGIHWIPSWVLNTSKVFNSVFSSSVLFVVTIQFGIHLQKNRVFTIQFSIHWSKFCGIRYSTHYSLFVTLKYSVFNSVFNRLRF